MNRLAHWMLRLYPKRWRTRYGDELDALLADSGADARVVTDLMRGGIRMQFKTWSFFKLAVTLVIVGTLMGVGLGLLLPSEYMSKATMQLTPAQINDDMIQSTISNSLNERIQQMQTSIMSRTQLSAIINDPHLLLYKGELRTTPLEDVIEEMKNNIHVSFVALPGALGKRAAAFDITFIYYDRFKAQQTVRALLNAFAQANIQSAIATQDQTSGRLEVLDSARLPASSPYFELLPFHQYQSSATVRLRGAAADHVGQLTSRILSRTSLSALINNPHLNLYKDRLKTTSLEDVIQTMKQNIKIGLVGDRRGGIFTISFDYPDPYKAQATVTALVSRFSETEAQSFSDAGRQPAAASTVLDVLDTPNLPMSPVRPNRYTITFLGGFIGLAIASVVTLIRRRWHPEPDFPIDAVQQ